MTQLHGARSGHPFGRGGATTAQQDLANADASDHGLHDGGEPSGRLPLGDRGARARRHVIHVDPRFTRTSALADLWVPLRAGTDIVFLGGLINYVLENETVLPRLRRALHQRGDDHLARSSRTPKTLTACSPAGTSSAGRTTLDLGV